jgi:hypothetical protein
MQYRIYRYTVPPFPLLLGPYNRHTWSRCQKSTEYFKAYDHIAWFPDLSVARRICSSACLYNLKANRNLASILKYTWFSKMIVQNGHSLQSNCEVRKWKHVIWDFSLTLLAQNKDPYRRATYVGSFEVSVLAHVALRLYWLAAPPSGQ